MIAQGQLTALQCAGNAAAAEGLAALNLGYFQLAFGAVIQHGAGQRVFTAALQGAGLAQQRGFISIDGIQVNDARLAGGQGASLVEGYRSNGVSHFQGFGVFDQDAVARRHAGAGHNCSRRGQTKGARAGDDQHGHGVDQRGFQRGTGQQPAAKSEQGDDQHRRDEYFTDPVNQLLNRRLGRLGVFHQANDARQHTFSTQGGGAHDQTAFAVDGASGYRAAGLLGHGQAFAGNQRLVGLALAVDDFA